MEEFPAQSHKSREPREIRPVTTEAAQVRPTPLSRRFREAIMPNGGRGVWSTMLWDVFLPGLGDNINDAMHNGIDSLFGGGNASVRRNRYASARRSSRTPNNVSRHNPDRALGSSSGSERFSDDDRRNHNFSVLEINSRVEAEEVLSQMNLLIDQYDVCQVAEFLQMVRISPTPTDYKFGWEELGGARVVHSRGSYYIDLPQPIELRRI